MEKKHKKEFIAEKIKYSFEIPLKQMEKSFQRYNK